MSKNLEVRETMSNYIMKMDLDDKIKLDKIIYDKLINHDLINKSKVIGIYHSTESEVNTRALIYTWLLNGKEICIPRVEDENRMTMREIDSIEFKKEKFGDVKQPEKSSTIVLPKDIDVFIYTCTAFNEKGDRLGKGFGYFNNYLKDYKGPKICLAYDLQKLKNDVEVEQWDNKPDIIITETKPS